MDRHRATRKHQMVTNGNTRGEFLTKEEEGGGRCHCPCGRSYSSRPGLSRHKKTCMWTPPTDNTLLNNTDVLFRMLETQSKMIDSQAKAAENNAVIMQKMANTMVLASANTSNINCNNTNSNNKSFNLQFFLNTTCKDAISAAEFINQIQITFADIENIANNGYEEGIYTVISNKLNTMAVHERPFHCTDIKRETIYIKDKDEWLVDDHKQKIKNIIHAINRKNQVVGNQWIKAHPDANRLDSDDNRTMFKIFEQVCALPVDQEEKSQEKIIKKLAKDVRVEK